MRFSVISVLAALGSGAVAQLSASAVVQNINTLTTKSQNLIQPANKLSITNAPLLIVGQGPWPKVILGFTDIVATATVDISAMSAGPKAKYVGADATAIGDAFRAFVKIHQELLNVLIGNGGSITRIPFVGASVAAVLRSIEGIVDRLAFGLIDTVEASVAAGMKADLASLDVTIGESMKVYGA